MAVTVGITGGMGSGKSIACKIFRLLDVPVFEADGIAKELLDNHPEIRNELTSLFGESIYLSGQGANRKKLASLIFHDPVALMKVNNIIHPRVREAFIHWTRQQKAPYVLHEAAILFESGFYKMMDRNILIRADKELRIQRIMKRDGLSREQIKARMDQQWPDEKKAQLADYILVNNHELLLPEILRIHKKIEEYGKIW
jgi:dephospho-CoA kinase